MLVWRVTKGTDVAAERKLDPMQTEVDVISQEWETARGKRESPGSVDLNTQKSKRHGKGTSRMETTGPRRGS